jgi:hypothetical protein
MITQPGHSADGPYSGVIRADVNLGLKEVQTNGVVFLDFGAIPKVDLTASEFPEGDRAEIMLAVRQWLQLLHELELAQTNVPLTNQFDARVIIDPASVDGDCLAMMLATEGTELDPAAFTASPVLPDYRVVIVISGVSLLGDEIRPHLEQEIREEAEDPDSLPEELFLPSCVLAKPVDLGEGEVTLTAMNATIKHGQVIVEAIVSASGFGWTATGSLTQVVTIGVDDEGRLTQTPQEPLTNVRFDVEWWVWLLSIFFGFPFDPITIAIIDAIGDALTLEPVSSQLPESGDEPPRPFPGVVLEDAVLDDNLCLYGRLERDLTLAQQTVSEGTVELLNHRNLDLETGLVRGPINVLNEVGWFWGEQGMLTYNADLGWADTNEGSGLWIQGIAQAKLLDGLVFEYVRLDDVVNMFAMGPDLLNHDDPLLPAREIPNVEEDGVVLAVRTGAGRYAKCLVWRDLSRASLWVRYVTYEEGYIDPSSGGTEYHPGTSIFDAHPEIQWIKIADDGKVAEDYIATWDDDYEPPHPGDGRVQDPTEAPGTE